MKIVQIYEAGNLFSPDVLDVDESVLVERFMSGIKAIAAISLAINYPTIASITHSLVNSYKNLLAVSVATDYTFEGAEKVKEYLANPEAFAAAAPVAAAAEAAPAAAAEEAKEEEKEGKCSDTRLLTGVVACPGDTSTGRVKSVCHPMHTLLTSTLARRFVLPTQSSPHRVRRRHGEWYRSQSESLQARADV